MAKIYFNGEEISKIKRKCEDGVMYGHYIAREIARKYDIEKEKVLELSPLEVKKVLNLIMKKEEIENEIETIIDSWR